MEAIEILHRCRNGEEDVWRLRRRLRQLERCGASADAVKDDLEACQAAMAKRIRALDAETMAACRIVDTLPDPACGILYRYFVARQSQGEIAAALHITSGYYKRKKREGLAVVQEMDGVMVDALLPEWYRVHDDGT